VTPVQRLSKRCWREPAALLKAHWRPSLESAPCCLPPSALSQLKDALNVVWEVEVSEESGLWHFARSYVLSFALVLALGFLLLVSLLVTAALAAAGKFVAPYLPEGILHVVSLLVSFADVTVLFAMMFKWLPDVSVAWRDVWLGAFITALFFDLRSCGLERIDLGLLHVADHLDRRRGHPQLREAQRLSEAARRLTARPERSSRVAVTRQQAASEKYGSSEIPV